MINEPTGCATLDGAYLKSNVGLIRNTDNAKFGYPH